jgi:hypothetical protein
VRDEKLVAEAGDSSGTQKERNVCRWKPLQKQGLMKAEKFLCAAATVIFGVCPQIVVVICSYECKCPINPITNPNPIYSHTTRHYEGDILI